jgi:outer membrane protein OmpA-like peptidoglycan-associated protein
MARRVLALLACIVLMAGVVAAQQDIPGSSDHALFTRMPGFYIGEYQVQPFDSYQFHAVPGEPRVEGKITTIRYWAKGETPAPGALAICRNYTNAAKQVGGVVLNDNGRNMATLKIAKEGKEAWAEIACDNNRYSLVIVEKQALEQVVTASDMLTALDKQGFIALDIHFDTAKAVIKPESQPIVEQIVALLKGNPKLKISVEGHTDNVGTAASNQKLSEARAAAVVAAIVSEGIDRGRLSSAGFGQDHPVADNRTEEGRAKNRRVELVRK